MTTALSPDTIAELDRVVQAFGEAAHIPGIAYGVLAHGELIHHSCSGVSVLDGPPPDQHTQFRIASMTKSFTAAAVLRARDHGLVSLHEPLRTYVPEIMSWPQPPDAPEMTLFHLLSMSAGLVTDDPWADRHLDISHAEIVQVLNDGPLLAFAPGEAFQYSNLGYGIIGLAFQRAVGTRVQDYISQHFLRPLGMTNTAWEVADPAAAGVATGYHRVDEQIVQEPAPLGDGWIAPMGGLWSTVADLATWMAMWCDAWPAAEDQGNAPLRRSSRREAQRVHTDIVNVTPPVPANAHRTLLGYGFGLRINRVQGLGRVVDHSGGVPGFGTNMRWVPERGLGVVALANLRYAETVALTASILDVIHHANEVPAPPVLHSSAISEAAHALVRLFNNWDPTVAEQIFADNVDLDDALGRRQAAAAALVERHGTLSLRSVTARSAGQGDATLVGTDGLEIVVEVLLAPLQRRLIQAYSVREPS